MFQAINHLSLGQTKSSLIFTLSVLLAFLSQTRREPKAEDFGTDVFWTESLFVDTQSRANRGQHTQGGSDGVHSTE